MGKIKDVRNEKVKNDNTMDKIQMTYLAAKELYTYLYLLSLRAEASQMTNGTLKNFGSLSFGNPSKINFKKEADGLLNVNIDFFSVSHAWDDGKRKNQPYEKVRHSDWSWKDGPNKHGFSRLIDKNKIDFNLLKEILEKNYNTSFDFKYDEKVYGEMVSNGSEGEEITDLMLYYVVESRIKMSGRPELVVKDTFNEEKENQRIA